MREIDKLSNTNRMNRHRSFKSITDETVTLSIQRCDSLSKMIARMSKSCERKQSCKQPCETSSFQKAESSKTSESCLLELKPTDAPSTSHHTKSMLIIEESKHISQPDCKERDMEIKEPIANADFEVTLNTYKHETINRVKAQRKADIEDHSLQAQCTVERIDINSNPCSQNKTNSLAPDKTTSERLTKRRNDELNRSTEQSINRLESGKKNMFVAKCSSSQDLELFLEDERRAQEEVLKCNALKLDELENLLITNQKPLPLKETYDNNMKLNLLNVINNDRIANQVIEKEEDTKFERNSNDSCVKIQNKLLKEGTTISTMDAEIGENYHKFNKKLSDFENSPAKTNIPNISKKTQNILSKSVKRDELSSKKSRVMKDDKSKMLLSPVKSKSIQVAQTPVIQSSSVEARTSNYEIKPRDLNKSQIFNTFQASQSKKTKYLSINIVGNKSMKHKPDFSDKKSKSPKIIQFEGSAKCNSSSKYLKGSKISSLHRNSVIENTESRSIEPLKEREDYYIKPFKNMSKESLPKSIKQSQKMYYIHHSKTSSQQNNPMVQTKKKNDFRITENSRQDTLSAQENTSSSNIQFQSFKNHHIDSLVSRNEESSVKMDYGMNSVHKSFDTRLHK